MSIAADLEVLDRALLRLRRFLQAPRTVRDGDRRVELSTLLVLDAVEEAPGRATIRDVAQRLDVAHSTASRLVQRAVEAGMLIRAAAPRDPRQTALTPTPEGFALAARARDYRRAQLRQRLQDWSPAEIAGFAHALDRFAGTP